MTQKIATISQAPYYDDFDPAKDYIRVLFRPSYAVQARELTTLQTFIQEQITRFGDNVFKDGSVITGAELTIDTNIHRLSLTGSGNLQFTTAGALEGSSLATTGTLTGKIITNASGTVKAQVVAQPSSASSTSQIGNLFIKYITQEQFSSTGGYIYALPADNPSIVQNFFNTYSSTSVSTLGSIAGGVYYVKGVFTRVPNQTVLIDAASNTPSGNIGFTVTESIVTENDDSTLFENARGVSNEGAPGGHRLKLELTLTIKSLTAPADTNFYRLATIKNGVRQEKTNVGDEYNIINDVLARRTYDESGHYALKPFTQVVQPGDSDGEFTVKMGPSKAYVKGYEIEKPVSETLHISKGFENTNTVNNFKVAFAGTTSLQVTGVTGTLPGFDGNTGGVTYSNRLLLKDASDNVIGIARPYCVQTELPAGVAVTKLYLYDIRMFTVIEVQENNFAASTGEVLESLRVRGYVYNEDGTAGIADGKTLINTTGTIRNGQTVTNLLTNTSATIDRVTSFDISQVDSITAVDESNFSCTTVKEGGEAIVENSNSGLVEFVDRELSTLQAEIDNDYRLFATADHDLLDSFTDASMGGWKGGRFEDKDSTQKDIKFAYLRVAINDATARAGVGYGWSALDKEVSLSRTDTYRVYGINEVSTGQSSVSNTWTNGRFARVQIETVTSIPQGSTVTGDTSGSVAIVALSNNTSLNQQDKNTNQQTITGTGSSDVIEVIFQKGSGFTVDENLTVSVPSTTINAYTYSVKVVSNIEAVGGDITTAYYHDNGQRREYYDIGRLVRKPSVPAPNNDIVVFYSYFEDTNNNHYYSVDSYNTVDYFKTDVRFNETARIIGPFISDEGQDLRNAIDFRLKVNIINTLTASPFTFNNRSFISKPRIIPRSSFTTNIVEYLGRIDLIALDKNGRFINIQGIPSAQPKRPVEPVDAMTLSTVIIPPAVRYPRDEIYVELKDNKRYTMRDIGRLDARIKNVESAVALSLLESQALQDDVGERAKSGFLTDDFSVEYDAAASAGDHNHEEWNASVDVVNKALIPAQTGGVQVPLRESNTSGISTFFEDHYINQFTEVSMVSQMQATGTHLINPFAVWTYNGQVKLTPDEQNWRVERRSYFVERFGERQPVSEDDFVNFGKITTSSPGGRSVVETEWVGRPTKSTFGGHSAPAHVKARVFELGRQFGGRRHYQERATTTSQARRTTTTTFFDSPRAHGEAVETLARSTLVENPQEYFMKPEKVTFSAKGLKSNTPHKAFFGGKELTSIGIITSNDDGEVSGTFTIPANTFPAGAETFLLINTLEGVDQDTDVASAESIATATFRSIGHVDEINVVQRTATQVSTFQDQTVVKSVDFSDPIAQLFTMPLENIKVATRDVDAWTQDITTAETSILTSIDIWFGFVDTRKSMNKVIIEIREAVNGYPGGPDKIIGTTGSVDIGATNAATEVTAATASNFKFLAPVQLRNGTEYAIVIKSPSNATNVYVATIGENLLGGGIHDSQPNVGGYYGSFFKSQNSSTWEPDQNVDLTFNLNRAQFTEGATGVVTMIAAESNVDNFRGDIGAFYEGTPIETFANTEWVKVHHKNHGLNHENASVTLEGCTTVNGIPGTALNATHQIVPDYATIDSYFIKLPNENKATATGRPALNQLSVFATQNIVYDSMIVSLLANQQERDEVSITATPATTAPVVITRDGQKITNTKRMNVAQDSIAYHIPEGEAVEFTEPKIVRNALNRGSAGPDLSLSIAITNGTQWSSPFFKKRTAQNVLVFRNLVGVHTTDTDVEALTVRSVSSTDDSDTRAQFVSYVQAVQSEAETCAYVTKEIELEIPADSLNITFDADMEPGSSVDISYKIRELGQDVPFADIEWVDFPAGQQINDANYGPFESSAGGRAYNLEVEDLPEFSAFKVRIRLTTENEALIPRVKDLRIIASI